MPQAAPFPIKYASVGQAVDLYDRRKEREYREKMRGLQEEAGGLYAAGDTQGAIGTLAKSGNIQGAAQLQGLQMEQEKFDLSNKLRAARQIAGAGARILQMQDPNQQRLAYRALRADAALNKNIDVSSAPPDWGPDAQAYLNNMVGKHAEIEGILNRQSAEQRTEMTVGGAEKRAQIAADTRKEVASQQAADRLKLAQEKARLKGEEQKPATFKLPSGKVTNGFTMGGDAFYKDENGNVKPVPFGGHEVSATGTLTEIKSDKVAARDWNATVDAATAFTQLSNQVIDEIKSGKVRLGVAGTLVSTVNNLRAQANQLAGVFGTEKDERALEEYVNADNWKDTFKGTAISNQRVKSALTLMAYMLAKISDRSGRVSDKDFEAHLKALAADAADPDVLTDTIVQRTNQMHQRLAARAKNEGRDLPAYEDWGYGETPGAAPRGAPQGAQTYRKGDRVITMDEIESTARKRGMSPDEVIRRLELTPATEH